MGRKTVSEYKYAKYFRFGVYAPLFLALFIPLVFNSSFLFPFITPKTLLFRILVEIALVSYVALAIWEPKYRPRKSLMTYIIGGYFVIVTLAAVLGVNPYKSFWGNIERGEGLLTLYHVGLWWFMLAHTFKTASIWKWFLGTAVGVSLLEAFYALAQKTNKFPDLVINSGENRLSGTIGNASFLAAFLLIGVFITLTLFIQAKDKVWKGIYGAIIVFELIIIFYTQTRGALLALVAGFVLATILINMFARSHTVQVLKKRFTLASLFNGLLIALVLFGGIIWFNRDAKWVTSQGTLNRLVTISWEDVTTQSRIQAWETSFQGWQDRFLLGYGYENYSIAFNKYFPPEIFLDSGSQLWFDRAHNIIFDQAVASGILGLLAYIAIFAIALRYLMQIMRNSDSADPDHKQTVLLAITLFVGLLAYLGQNVFVFDTLGTYMGFYLLLAYIYFLVNKDGVEHIQVREDERRFENTNNWIVMAIVVLVVGMGMYSFNIKPAKANMHAIDALVQSRIADNAPQGADPAVYANEFYPKAFDLFRKSINLETYQSTEVRQKMSEIILMAARNRHIERSTRGSYYDYGIEQISKNIEEAPEDVQNYMYLMTLYNASSSFDAGRLQLVLDVGEKALELSPTRPQIYFDMGQAAVTLGRNDEGIEYFEKAVALNEWPIESKWNLAAALVLSDREEEAQVIFDQLIEERNFAYYGWENALKMERVYRSIRKYDEAIELHMAAMTKDKGDEVRYRAQIAGLYAQKAAWLEQEGDLQGAKAAVLEAVKFDPNLQAEADIFIQKIDQGLL